MNDVEFERLLSRKVGVIRDTNSATLCLRDAVFDYFCKQCKNNDERANLMTKDFFDTLYLQFVNRKM